MDATCDFFNDYLYKSYIKSTCFGFKTKLNRSTTLKIANIFAQTVRRPHKIRHREESIYAPRSLFDRPSAALLKMRRDIKLQKFRGMPGGIVRPAVPIPGLKQQTTVKTTAETEHVPDWLIYEDMVLLQVILV